MHLVRLERPVRQGVHLVADLRHVATGELGGVDDEHPTLGHVADVRLQCGRIHTDEHLRCVAGSLHVVVGELELEGRDAGQGPARCPDLRGEVRQRRDVIAQCRALGGEAVTGQLHAVT